ICSRGVADCSASPTDVRALVRSPGRWRPGLASSQLAGRWQRRDNLPSSSAPEPGCAAQQVLLQPSRLGEGSWAGQDATEGGCRRRARAETFVAGGRYGLLPRSQHYPGGPCFCSFVLAWFYSSWAGLVSWRLDALRLRLSLAVVRRPPASPC